MQDPESDARVRTAKVGRHRSLIPPMVGDLLNQIAMCTNALIRTERRSGTRGCPTNKKGSRRQRQDPCVVSERLYPLFARILLRAEPALNHSI